MVKEKETDEGGKGQIRREGEQRSEEVEENTAAKIQMKGRKRHHLTAAEGVKTCMRRAKVQ